MKKKILLILLLLVGIFTISGCAADNESSVKKEKFYDLYYVEPKNYTSVTEFGEDTNKTKNFIYGNIEGSISINYKKGNDYSEVENLFFNEHTEKKINDTTWRVMENEDAGVKSVFYYTVYNDDLYLIELNGIDQFKTDMEEFIKTVSFK